MIRDAQHQLELTASKATAAPEPEPRAPDPHSYAASKMTYECPIPEFNPGGILFASKRITLKVSDFKWH